MNQKIPDYLNEKKNIISLIVYTAIFALAFINIYQPFGSQQWYPVTKIKYFLFSSLIILTGVLVVVLSRMIMYQYAKKNDLLLWQYMVWVLAEILAMGSFYTAFEKIALQDPRDLMDMIRESTINTGLILLLPYSTIWLYFAWKDNKNKLENLSHDGEESVTAFGKGMFNFLDEKNELRLSVHTDQVLWLEAADNYVKIHYLNKGKIATFMIRNSLKVMEENFEKTALIRCNRSVIVNFDKVKVLRKEKEGIFLGLEQENAPDIPVSKTYADRVMARFSSHSI
ncbi:MAG: LytTR family DNA-binding domain-containing protein [Bacteroidota bacterium]|nr:LytTR family DNA-binding domain-containing protein [Bacteroidota bacterium]